MTGNVGTCLLVLAAALAVGVRWPRALAPVTATGALALTAYTGQLAALAALGPEVVYGATTGGWVTFVLVTVALCWVWHAALGRGPLEALLHVVSVRAADVAPDALPPRRGTDAVDAPTPVGTAPPAA